MTSGGIPDRGCSAPCRVRRLPPEWEEPRRQSYKTALISETKTFQTDRQTAADIGRDDSRALPWNLTIAAGAGREDRGVAEETWTSAEEDAVVCRWILTTTHLRNRQAQTGQDKKSGVTVGKNAALRQRHLLHACAAGPVADRRADGSVQLRSGASATGVLQRRCRWVQRCCCCCCCCCLPVLRLHICRESAAFHRLLCSLQRFLVQAAPPQGHGPTVGVADTHAYRFAV